MSASECPTTWKFLMILYALNAIEDACSIECAESCEVAEDGVST